MPTPNSAVKFLLTGTLSTLVLLGSATAQSQSATFSNTVDGYIEVPYNSSVVPSSGITVEAWVQYDESTLPTGWRYPTIVRQNAYGGGGNEAYFLRVQANSSKNTAIRWLVNTQGAGVRTVDWNFGPGGLLTWTHIAGTYDGSTLNLYADGVLVATNSGSGPIVDNGDVLRIGKGSEVGSPMEVFNGSLDEVRIWPFARTIGEINATKDMQLSSFPGLVSTWNLEGDGLDTSGSNHGTVKGSVTFGSTGPVLGVQPFPGAEFGTSSPACMGDILATAGSLPNLGNSAFSMVAHRVPNGATFAYIGLSSLAAPFQILGLDIWVNPVTAVGLFPATVDPLGTARLDFPVPPSFPPGFQATLQFISFDPCAPTGISASRGLGFLLIP